MKIARKESCTQPTNYRFVSQRRYSLNVNRGTIPHSLANRVHSMPWPIEMDEDKYILNYNNQLVSSGRRLYFHNGIDIMCSPGTEVTLSEEGKVVLCEFDDRFGSGKELSDIYVEAKSGLLWVYRHLDRKSIPKELLEIEHYTPESNVHVGIHDVIGTVGSWLGKANSMDIIPSFYKKRYENPHHLHIEAHANLKELNGETSFNPLLLLTTLPYLDSSSHIYKYSNS